MVIMHSGCLEVYGITYTHQGYICFGILEAALTAPPSFGEVAMDKHRLDVPFGLINHSFLDVICRSVANRSKGRRHVAEPSNKA